MNAKEIFQNGAHLSIHVRILWFCRLTNFSRIIPSELYLVLVKGLVVFIERSDFRLP